MKIDLNGIPDGAMRDAVSVGDVYRANGGRGECKFWLVVAITLRTAHCIGVNEHGDICTSISYQIHVFERRELVGRCEELVDFSPAINWMV